MGLKLMKKLTRYNKMYKKSCFLNGYKLNVEELMT